MEPKSFLNSHFIFEHCTPIILWNILVKLSHAKSVRNILLHKVLNAIPNKILQFCETQPDTERLLTM